MDFFPADAAGVDGWRRGVARVEYHWLAGRVDGVPPHPARRPRRPQPWRWAHVVRQRRDHPGRGGAGAVGGARTAKPGMSGAWAAEAWMGWAGAAETWVCGTGSTETWIRILITYNASTINWADFGMSVAWLGGAWAAKTWSGRIIAKAKNSNDCHIAWYRINMFKIKRKHLEENFT